MVSKHTVKTVRRLCDLLFPAEAFSLPNFLRGETGGYVLPKIWESHLTLKTFFSAANTHGFLRWLFLWRRWSVACCSWQGQPTVLAF